MAYDSNHIPTIGNLKRSLTALWNSTKSALNLKADKDELTTKADKTDALCHNVEYSTKQEMKDTIRTISDGTNEDGWKIDEQTTVGIQRLALTDTTTDGNPTYGCFLEVYNDNGTITQRVWGERGFVVSEKNSVFIRTKGEDNQWGKWTWSASFQEKISNLQQEIEEYSIYVCKVDGTKPTLKELYDNTENIIWDLSELPNFNRVFWCDIKGTEGETVSNYNNTLEFTFPSHDKKNESLSKALIFSRYLSGGAVQIGIISTNDLSALNVLGNTHSSMCPFACFETRGNIEGGLLLRDNSEHIQANRGIIFERITNPFGIELPEALTDSDIEDIVNNLTTETEPEEENTES